MKIFSLKKKTGSTFKPLLNKKDKTFLAVVVACWFIAEIFFLSWWFDTQHITSSVGFAINSLLLVVLFLSPAWFLTFIFRSARVRKNIKIPQYRVAMITTKVPSEPFEIVKKNLLAMLKQNYPYKYDVWLADEQVTQETKDWCDKHNVKISCRYGVAEYHQPQWPRRTRCKEGNLAYFYDKYGYDNYDIVAQFDTDHIPDKNYLKNILKPFSNSKIGYVAAPNVCDANVKDSWVARGRLYFDASMHGIMQASYNEGYAPLCIGGHYAVRTVALKQAGGLGPELAEDHSTTMLMNSAGWDGAYAFDAIAHGDGPLNFTDAMTQEFQWSRSLMNLLFGWTGKYLKGLTPKKRLQFLYAQMWYLLYLFTMLGGFVLPIVALATNYPLVNVDYFEFIIRYWACDIFLIIISVYIQRKGHLRPVNSPVFSWEAILYNIVRWPWTLMGLIYSISDSIRKKAFAFKITPKGEAAQESVSLSSILPYAVLSAISSGVAIYFALNPYGFVKGYYYLVLVNALIYLIVTAAIVLKHTQENLKQTTLKFPQFIVLIGLLVLLGSSVFISR